MEALLRSPDAQSKITMDRIKNIFKKISFSQAGSLAKKDEFNPFRDWGIIFSVSLLLFFFLAVFGAWFFLTLDFSPPAQNTLSAKAINSRGLEEILGSLRTRAVVFSELESTVPKKSDPSL